MKEVEDSLSEKLSEEGVQTLEVRLEMSSDEYPEVKVASVDGMKEVEDSLSEDLSAEELHTLEVSLETSSDGYLELEEASVEAE